MGQYLFRNFREAREGRKLLLKNRPLSDVSDEPRHVA